MIDKNEPHEPAGTPYFADNDPLSANNTPLSAKYGIFRGMRYSCV
jgi:hypothetical protein